MRITILGSGSTGNATLVQFAGTSVLIDAGIRIGILKERMLDLVGSVDIDGIVITHYHGDHSAHVNQYAKEFDAPVFFTRSTEERSRLKDRYPRRLFAPTQAFRVGKLDFVPLPLPHDAPQVALRFGPKDAQAALITDLGSAPPGLADYLKDCHTVLLESNHDSVMLENGPYHASLRARVASDVGHLSNNQCASIIQSLSPKVQRIVLMHLSQKNNHPELAYRCADKALYGRKTDLRIAGPSPLQLYIERPLPMSSQVQLSFTL